MRNHKEKAEELVLKFLRVDNNTKEWFNKYIAKQCSIIMVNEILEDLNFTHIGYGKQIIQGYQKTKKTYWNEVKREIEKL